MNSAGKVYVIGAGGHAKVVISTLQAAGYDVKGVFDDDARKWGGRLLGIPVLGSAAELNSLAPVRAVVAVGSNPARKVLAERFLKVEWVTVVHPKAEVHSSVQLGAGTVVFAGAVIQPDAIIGAHAIINTGATVDHDCIFGDYVQVAPGVHLSGNTQLSEGVFLGTGSATVPGVKIGSWTTVGAGGVVVSDLPADVTAVGVPASPIKKREQA